MKKNQVVPAPKSATVPANLQSASRALVSKAKVATAASPNETNLRHELENALEDACKSLGITWTPYTLDRSMLGEDGRRFADVAHGAVVIEYEPPRSLSAPAKLRHAQKQADEYASILAKEEGRAIGDYILVTWDGDLINFGRFTGTASKWEAQTPFDEKAASRLIGLLQSDGTPLVHPLLLSQITGPESEHGDGLIPLLFSAIKRAEAGPTSKTKLLYLEWRRLFGQVVGIQDESLKTLLGRQGVAHGQDYAEDPSAYLYALNTYIALVAKIVAACALTHGAVDIKDGSIPVTRRLELLENGQLFLDAGISNMLSGDFFSWYRDDADCKKFFPRVDQLINSLSGVSFDVQRKTPESTRDLFKGLYESFVPRELRHALGEFYTPDWLACHVLDTVKWTVDAGLTDPTSGSGTFLLEALRRRIASIHGKTPSAYDLILGITGLDLNPLAVLCAKGSLAVYLAPYLDATRPIRLPVYLADAINPATEAAGYFHHTLLTERGKREFVVPAKLVRHETFFDMFRRIGDLVDAEKDATIITKAVQTQFNSVGLTSDEWTSLGTTIEVIVDLHNQQWNGIWCSILADRFAAGAVPAQKFVCGNPPWVKWSHLPPDYASFIQPRCRAMGVFSQDKWVGGIESDISTVITFEAIDRFLADKGRLAFLITGTVFVNESSGGFRLFSLHEGKTQCKVLVVEDYQDVDPFEGVSNHATLLVLEKGKANEYPVPYKRWTKTAASLATYDDGKAFRGANAKEDLIAIPVPGGADRPWLTGTTEQRVVWETVFADGPQNYTARKGVTTDRNGIYWVKVLGSKDDLVQIENQANIGRTKGIPTHKTYIEPDHLFPLVRGRHLSKFKIELDDLHIVLPQREMHGDPDLPVSSPETFKFLRRFKGILEGRSSLRRFQKGKPYWSTWSTGPYTFSPFKVLWKEMPGGRFDAAYIGSVDDAVLGKKLVIPDHKLYFIPVKTESEAAYLTAFLNAKTVAAAIDSYASQLSLGGSVAEYLHLPVYSAKDADHKRLAALGKAITHRKGVFQVGEEAELDALALRVIHQSITDGKAAV